MNSAFSTSQNAKAYELRFRSLFDDGKALAFPCNANGEVDMDALSQRARDNYLAARALIGRQFAWPAVQSVALH
ncbi:MAG: hypothetical protein ABI589_12190 [Burkholderiales bacterium]